MSQATATQRSHEPIPVSRKDLPLSCPPRGVDAYGLHPRVYLPIEAGGRAVCPYCGAEYVLQD